MEDAMFYIKELQKTYASMDKKVAEAVDMAIEALKENNRSDSLVTDSPDACKESESKLDLISRQDAIKNAHFPMIDDAGYEVVRVDDILALPSAEAVQGEWVWSDEDASWMCGACCCVFEEIDWKPNYNFCPNCGARMRGEEE